MCHFSSEKDFDHSSIQSLSCVRVFVTPWTAAHQASLSFTIFWSLLRFMSIESVMTIQSSHTLSPLSPLALNLSQHQGLFQWVGSLHQVAKVLEPQLQYRSFQWIVRLISFRDWLVWSPCSPRDSQESSPTPQFENINSWVLSLCYGPALTFIGDSWKKP